MKYSMERSQSRKQAKISLYNHDYIHQKENMLANATLRPECKHFQSHRSSKEPLIYKFTTLHACNVQVVFFVLFFLLPIKGYTVFCCKYQTHLQYMQKIRMQVLCSLYLSLKCANSENSFKNEERRWNINIQRNYTNIM